MEERGLSQRLREAERCVDKVTRRSNVYMRALQRERERRKFFEQEAQAAKHRSVALSRQVGRERSRKDALEQAVEKQASEIKALRAERAQLKKELAATRSDWSRHWAWVTAQWGQAASRKFWALGYKAPVRARDSSWGGGQ